MPAGPEKGGSQAIHRGDGGSSRRADHQSDDPPSTHTLWSLAGSPEGIRWPDQTFRLSWRNRVFESELVKV